MDDDTGVPVECATFFVGRRAQVIWGTALAEKNLEYLRSIDAGYFDYVARTNAPLLDGENRHHAAAAIRIAYGQALETLMALISAALQATHCPLGWMLTYQNQQLMEAIADISTSDRSYLVPLVAGDPLELLASEMFTATPWPEELQDSRAKAFAKCWQRWCGEFLDDYQTTEYNALKHGNRTRLGGFVLSIGPEIVPGQAADPTTMHTIGNSEFGSTFFTTAKIQGRLHQRPVRVFRNWSPLTMGNALLLMSMSISNIASFLRIRADDDPITCRFTVPTDENAYELPWQGTTGVNMMTGLDYLVGPGDIEPWNAGEVTKRIRRRYRSAQAAEQAPSEHSEEHVEHDRNGFADETDAE